MYKTFGDYKNRCIQFGLDNIERRSKKIMHSLNSLRVIFELNIVSHHIADFGNENTFIQSYGTTYCLMSFFSVLSGFVSTYTTDGKDTGYFVRRFKKEISLLHTDVVGWASCCNIWQRFCQ